MDYRVILFHKHPTSARTRFVKYSYGSICAFEKLNPLAQLVAAGTSDTLLHPAKILTEIESKLGFAVDTLEAQGEFRQFIDVPGGPVQVLLVAVTTIDPPFDLAANTGAGFIDLTEARGLPQVELDLLRKAYEYLLGG